MRKKIAAAAVGAAALGTAGLYGNVYRYTPGYPVPYTEAAGPATIYPRTCGDNNMCYVPTLTHVAPGVSDMLPFAVEGVAPTPYESAAYANSEVMGGRLTGFSAYDGHQDDFHRLSDFYKNRPRIKRVYLNALRFVLGAALVGSLVLSTIGDEDVIDESVVVEAMKADPVGVESRVEQLPQDVRTEVNATIKMSKTIIENAARARVNAMIREQTPPGASVYESAAPLLRILSEY